MEISKLGVNIYYGHAAIIRNYCGYSEELPLPLVIQHGGSAYYDLWEMTDEYLFDYWVWDDEVKEMNIKNRHLPPQTIHVLGAPFLYLADDFKTSLSDVERQGTIAFPNHSSPCTPAIQDFQEYASQLEALPDEFHPISVCLHPYDICLGLHIPFQKKGFTVISCVPEVITYYQDIVNNKNLFWYLYKQSYTPSYLTNFINYCADKKYATGNFWTTPACYSIYLGLQFFLYGNKTKYEKGEYLSSSSEEMEYYRRIEAILTLTKDAQVADAQAQWEIASTKLGIKHKMGKSELYSYLTNLYKSRPYVEGLRQKFVLLEQTEAQVQTLQVQLQESTMKVEEFKAQVHKIQSDKESLQLQINQVHLLKEICQFVLKQTQLQLENYSAGLTDEKIQPGRQRINQDIDVMNQSFDEQESLLSHKKALELDPANPFAYHRMGKLLTKLGYLEEGILCYNHAISLDNKIAIFYSDLAESMVKVEYLEKAIIYYRRAINLKLFKDKLNTE
jgi:tetratricopeptide (TPR) repeat protein